MPLDEFIVAVFVLVDDTVKRLFGNRTPWRRRGPQPTQSDSEVLTMEIVGEFRGLDTDKGIFEYFRIHWATFFPDLKRIGRTAFVRQASRLAPVKRRLLARGHSRGRAGSGQEPLTKIEFALYHAARQSPRRHRDEHAKNLRSIRPHSFRARCR